MTSTYHVHPSVRVKLTGQIETKREKKQENHKVPRADDPTSFSKIIRKKSDSEIICRKLNGKVDTPIDIDLINPSAENQK